VRTFNNFHARVVGGVGGLVAWSPLRLGLLALRVPARREEGRPECSDALERHWSTAFGLATMFMDVFFLPLRLSFRRQPSTLEQARRRGRAHANKGQWGLSGSEEGYSRRQKRYASEQLLRCVYPTNHGQTVVRVGPAQGLTLTRRLISHCSV